MIGAEDQEELFRLIADYLERDIECIAIGGTAMIFHGYKTATKDIDVVFRNTEDRQAFIDAIEKLGYSPSSLKALYGEKRLESKNRPVLYSRGDERFDLFVRDVFGFVLEFENFLQRHDYIGKQTLTIFTAPIELLILMKAVTDRERDYEDIEAIVQTEKSIDWKGIARKAISQRGKVPWILMDLEEKLRRLKKITLIKKEVFEELYKAELRAQKKRK